MKKTDNRKRLDKMLQLIRNNIHAYGGSIHQLKDELNEKFNLGFTVLDIINFEPNNNNYSYKLAVNHNKHVLMQGTESKLIRNFCIPVNSFSNFGKTECLNYIAGYIQNIENNATR